MTNYLIALVFYWIYVEIIRLLAKHGANYDVNYDITSPLQIAKKAGHLEAVAEIQKWLDVNRLAP